MVSESSLKPECGCSETRSRIRRMNALWTNWIGFDYGLPVKDVTRERLHLNMPPVIGPNSECIASPTSRISTQPSLISTQLSFDSIIHIQKGSSIPNSQEHVSKNRHPPLPVVPPHHTTTPASYHAVTIETNRLRARPSQTCSPLRTPAARACQVRYDPAPRGTPLYP